MVNSMRWFPEAKASRSPAGTGELVPCGIGPMVRLEAAHQGSCVTMEPSCPVANASCLAHRAGAAVGLWTARHSDSMTVRTRWHALAAKQHWRCQGMGIKFFGPPCLPATCVGWSLGTKSGRWACYPAGSSPRCLGTKPPIERYARVTVSNGSMAMRARWSQATQRSSRTKLI